MCYCRHCGEEWNHAAEDCPLRIGDLADRVYDQMRDQAMDMEAPEEIPASEDSDN